MEELLSRLLDGDHRALARAITIIENRMPGHRELVSGLYDHTGDAEVIGITGSPGAGKSTLVDKVANHYRDQGLTVGIIGIDPSSPFTGGAVLGDRIRMASNIGDMDVFFRSMSARGSLGGVSIATADAVKALDAFGKDRIIVETVGAGQNEVDIIKTTDTVTVLLQPGSGDDVQMLKAGILEIADVFVVNKADLDGADKTVQELSEMIAEGGTGGANTAHSPGHHSTAEEAVALQQSARETETEWTPPILETVATDSEGVEEFVEALSDHRSHLESTGEIEAIRRSRYAEEIRTLLREDSADLLAEEIDARGGIDDLAGAIAAGETDPYEIADDVLGPIVERARQNRES